jgi:copper chaperone CopZ
MSAMSTAIYRTNLRCAGCIDTIRPHLDALPGLRHWSADVDVPDKPLTVEGDVSTEAVRVAMKQAGYEILGETQLTPPEPKPSYYPLVLIVAYLLGITLAVEAIAGSLDVMRAMRHFMAGFFLVFSFFKLLDLPAFAMAYTQYDVIAQRWRGYGYLYPFLELTLGAAYLVNWQPTITNIATAVLMAVGTVGVLQTIFAKRKVKCACLGAAINLPVATVTLIEDAGMGLMALAMLVWR